MNINIYLEKDTGLLNYHSNSQRKVFFPYLIKSLEENTGLNFQVVDQKTKKFEKSIDYGIPDIIIGVEDYKRNNKKYHYIDIPVDLLGAMITRKDYPSINFKENNSRKKIVYVKGDQIKNEIIRKYRNQITLIPKPNQKEAIKTVLSKEADIYVEDYQESLKYIVKNPNNGVKINYLSSVFKTDYYIGGKAEFQPLIDIIERIIKNMDTTIKNSYVDSLSYTKDKLNIPKQIQSYIKNKQSIRVLIPSFEEFPQLYYLNSQKESKGFLKNYFDELDKTLGIKIKFEKENKESNFDIDPFILSVNNEKLISKTKKIITTAPYIQIPLLIFNRNNRNFISSFDNLKKYHIGVVRNSFIERYLLYKGLNNNLIKFNNLKEVMEAVDTGKVDILIGGLQQINYFSNLYNIKSLQVAGIVQDNLELSFGISAKNKTLYSLINLMDKKFLSQIKQYEGKFFTPKIEIAKDYKLSIAISSISIILLSFVYNHLIKFKNISKKLKKLTIGLVETLENANTLNDEDTGSHIKRINKYSIFLAKELQLESKLTENIGLYASLHDVGKIGISDNILKKPGKLTKEEFEIMKNHVEIGYNLMKDLEISPVALNIIRYHHEKWNGMGYGKGLKGEEIPIEGRIVALADVYDALRQERVYKKAFTHKKSVEIIISEKNKHFDPEIVEILEKKHKFFQDIFEKNIN